MEDDNERWCHSKDFKRCHFIEGRSLSRIYVTKVNKKKPVMGTDKLPKIERGDIITAWVYKRPDISRYPCDQCLKQHSSKNLSCSKTLKRPTPYRERNVFYGFRTGKRHGHWRLLEHDVNLRYCVEQKKYMKVY